MLIRAVLRRTYPYKQGYDPDRLVKWLLDQVLDFLTEGVDNGKITRQELIKFLESIGVDYDS